MKTTGVRRFRSAASYTNGILAGNPVLKAGLALPFVVVVTTSLRNAVAITLALAITTVPTLCFASLLGSALPKRFKLKRVPKWIRIMIYPIVAGFLLFPASKVISPISPFIFDSLGVYFPLVTVNTIIGARSEAFSAKVKPLAAALDAVMYIIGFGLVALIMAAIREVLGNATFWGAPYAMLPIKLSGIQMPFFGFILLAFLAAGVNFTVRILKSSTYRRDNPQNANDEDIA